MQKRRGVLRMKKYIYNHKLANWLIRKGIMPCGAGTGAKGEDFIQFDDTYEIRNLISEWNTYFKSTK